MYKFNNKYIKDKKKILKEFGIPQNTIDNIDWSRFNSDIQVENYTRSLIMKHFDSLENR